MLATLVSEPFNRPGWVYEEKYDGERLLAYKEGRKVRLITRNNKDRTKQFAAVAAAVGALDSRTLLLDGELVARDKRGVSRFQLLQRGSARPVYVTFDCLLRDGVDLRHEPLSARRAILERCIRTGPTITISRRLGANGLQAFKKAKQEGYEGLVAKELSAPYVEGRSVKWLKVKVRHEDEFVICGYTKPRGARRYLGALLLGAYDQEELRYVGKVGTGFDHAALAELHRKLQPLVTARTVLVDAPRTRGLTFVSPKLVAQISFQEWTQDKKLRQPVFLGLRDDKSAAEVMLPPKSSS